MTRMKAGMMAVMAATLAGSLVAGEVAGAGEQDPVAKAVTEYFDTCFKDLKEVADKSPTKKSFREDMKAVAERTKGLFGGTLINTNFVIEEVYFKRDALARGYDLKKVKELDGFWKKMREKPEPQLSEPGHGNLVQPKLVAMRYPFLGTDGKLQGIVSMMVRTENFLQETKLDKCSAFQIVVDGKVAESKGTLTLAPTEVKLTLPSTEWVIKYDK